MPWRASSVLRTNSTEPSDALALLQEEDLAGDVPAEDADDEVEVAIAIEIGGLNVAHSSQAGKEDPGLVRRRLSVP